MSRIRTIKPEFFTSADIIELTPLSRLFYVSLWCESDREGRLNWNTRTLKFRYFPADDCDIDAMANELIEAGLIGVYQVNGKDYAEIPSFKNHQVINNRESDSVIPLRVSNAPFTRESGVQGEGKEGREGKGIRVASNASLAFDEFWSAYPKKKSKGNAEKAWATIKPDDELVAAILKAVRVASNTPEWKKDSGQFIPYPATWLRDKGWLDAVLVGVAAGTPEKPWVDPRWRGAK